MPFPEETFFTIPVGTAAANTTLYSQGGIGVGGGTLTVTGSTLVDGSEIAVEIPQVVLDPINTVTSVDP